MEETIGAEWVLIGSTWDDEGEWSKSTRAMAIDSVGCLVQVISAESTQITTALTFVPATKIEMDDSGEFGVLKPLY